MSFVTQAAIRWRIVTIAAAALIIVFGVWTVTRLQVELFPDIDFPLITLSAAYPGADAEGVLNNLTIPLEDSFSGLDGLDTIQSVSSPGFSIIIAEFEFGTDMAKAASAVAANLSVTALPEGVQPPRVARVSPDEFPVLQLSASRPGDLAELGQLVNQEIVPAIQAVPGVFSAEVPTSALAGTTITRTNGKPSLAISVLKEPDANTVDVVNDIMERLDEAKRSLPSDVEFTVVFNQATDIQASISSLQREAGLGALFAVVVIFVFLLSIRPTFVTSVSIPVSILAGLIIMYWQGMSLNILTLGGLAIAVGRVVDDSIVVMENIFRHIQMGEERRRASFTATKEVAGAIATSTFTTIAVFAPLAFLKGIIGAFFVPFALTVTFALLASLVVALTIVPALASLFLKPSEIGNKEERDTLLQRIYVPILRWALAHKAIAILIAFLTFVVSIAMLPGIPKTFLPSGDESLLSASVTLPRGTALEDMMAPNGPVHQIETVMDELRSSGAVDAYQVTVGSGNDLTFGPGSGSANGPNQATVFVELSDEANSQEISDLLRGRLAGSDRTVLVNAVQFGGPSNNDMELVLTGEDYTEVAKTAEKIVAALGDVQGLVNVSHNASAGGLPQNGLTRIARYNGSRAVTITGYITETNTQAVNRAVTKKIEEVDVPAGVEIQTGGVFADVQEAFTQMGISMLVGIALVFIVMVITLRSVLNPFVIILSLPLASVGVLLSLFITQRTLGMPALIGILMLIGLVITNSVVLIVFVEQLRSAGMRVYDALIQGGRTRLRPILMTAFTTSFALMPLAVVSSGGTIIGAELATVVIGGLATSTFLTLLVIPVVYRLLRRDTPVPLAAPADGGGDGSD